MRALGIRRRLPLTACVALTLAAAALPASAAPATVRPAGAGDPGYTIFSPPSATAGHDTAVEPSIGADWQTGAVLYQSDLTTLRVRFDDSGPAPVASWTDVSAPLTSVHTLDPILYTDRRTGRTLVSQLSGQDSMSEFTDDDGGRWTPSQGGGIPSGVDHQSIGAGPYNAGGVPPQSTVYPDAVYYCSQDVATAFCARSDTGGVAYGPGVPIYTVAQCGGLHGHIRVSPDGTAYVPNQACDPTSMDSYTKQAAVTSADNGVTWSPHFIPDSAATLRSDPSVAADSANTIYFGYEDGSGHARIATSSDHGVTWAASVDVGAPFGVQLSSFPEVIAGDAGRAAYAFLGSTTAPPKGDTGDFADDPKFAGSWELYVATTLDGGRTWVTTDATPGDPVEKGCIKLSSDRGCTHRNLYDFMDITLDEQGRVLVGYAVGCINACKTGADPDIADSNIHIAGIARQCAGPGLLMETKVVPGASCQLSAAAPGVQVPDSGRAAALVLAGLAGIGGTGLLRRRRRRPV